MIFRCVLGFTVVGDDSRTESENLIFDAMSGYSSPT